MKNLNQIWIKHEKNKTKDSKQLLKSWIKHEKMNENHEKILKS